MVITKMPRDARFNIIRFMGAITKKHLGTRRTPVATWTPFRKRKSAAHMINLDRWLRGAIESDLFCSQTVLSW